MEVPLRIGGAGMGMPRPGGAASPGGGPLTAENMLLCIPLKLLPPGTAPCPEAELDEFMLPG